jgi:hypothetical protein
MHFQIVGEQLEGRGIKLNSYFRTAANFVHFIPYRGP